MITTTPYVPGLLNFFYDNLVEKEIIFKEDVLSKGETKIMAVGKIEDNFRHIDIFYYSCENFPFALLFTTGSKEFNVNMRSHANKLGFSLNEKNLTKLDNIPVTPEEYKLKIGKNYPETEEDIFKFLDYKYIPPELRTN